MLQLTNMSENRMPYLKEFRVSVISATKLPIAINGNLVEITQIMDPYLCIS